VTRGTFGAGSGYDPINLYGDGAQSTQSGYTVRGGETLQSIAANVWGDGAMWSRGKTRIPADSANLNISASGQR
jgi:hypothetical protein